MTILENLLYIFIATLISSGTINYFVKKMIDKSIAKDVEKYKDNLNKLADQAKSYRDRLNQDFNLWTIKRHEAYASVHMVMSGIIEKISSFSALEENMFVDNETLKIILTSSEIFKYLSDGDKEYIIANWTKDRVSAVKRLKEFNDVLSMELFGEAFDIITKNRLYMTPEIYAFLIEIKESILEIFFDRLLSDEPENTQKLISEILMKWSKTTEKMQKELSGKNDLDK